MYSKQCRRSNTATAKRPFESALFEERYSADQSEVTGGATSAESSLLINRYTTRSSHLRGTASPAHKLKASHAAEQQATTTILRPASLRHGWLGTQGNPPGDSARQKESPVQAGQELGPGRASHGHGLG
jgi:hypothetical protein